MASADLKILADISEFYSSYQPSLRERESAVLCVCVSLVRQQTSQLLTVTTALHTVIKRPLVLTGKMPLLVTSAHAHPAELSSAG